LVKPAWSPLFVACWLKARAFPATAFPSWGTGKPVSKRSVKSCLCAPLSPALSQKGATAPKRYGKPVFLDVEHFPKHKFLGEAWQRLSGPVLTKHHCLRPTLSSQSLKHSLPLLASK